MTLIKIFITKDILNRSKNCTKGNPYETKLGQNCAIGLAIFDLFGNKSWVNCEQIEICERGIINSFEEGFNKTEYYITLPEEAREFIKAFDNYTPEKRVEMEPFSFEIEVPDEVIDMINIDEVKRICENSTTLSLVL